MLEHLVFSSDSFRIDGNQFIGVSFMIGEGFVILQKAESQFSLLETALLPHVKDLL